MFMVVCVCDDDDDDDDDDATLAHRSGSDAMFDQTDQGIQNFTL